MMTTLLAVCATLATAGAPWVRGAGEAYVKLGTSRFQSTGFVTPSGEVIDDTVYRGFTTSVYAEVGVAERLHAVVQLPAVGAINAVERTAGPGTVQFIHRDLGDAVLGLTAGHAIAGTVPTSITLRSKLPLYDNGDLARLGPAGGRFPAVGDGQVDVDAVWSVGSGLAVGDRRGWVVAEAGYRHRTEWWLGDSTLPDRVLGDGVIWRAQLGWSPSHAGRDLGWVYTEVDGVTAFQTDTVTRQHIQVGGGLGWKVGHGLALEAGALHMIHAVASAPGTGVTVGASWTR